MKRTIIIACFHVLISRNILQTALISNLVAQGFQVVILVPKHKIEYFKKNFERDGVIIEGVSAYIFSRNFLGLVLKRMSRSLVDTPTTRIRMHQKLIVQKRFFYYYAFHLPVRLLGKIPLAVKLIRFIDERFRPHRGYFSLYFAKYNPVAVISTDVNNENDVALMQDAKEEKISYIAILRSWDNLTNFLMRIVPQRLLVQNEILKEQAIRYQKMKPENVDVVGIAHYDRYRNGPTMTRSDFFKKIGLNPGKPLILYVPISDFRVKENDVDEYVLEILSKTDYGVLVRVPPAGTMTLHSFVPSPNIVIDVPGVNFGSKGESELSIEDDNQLINSLFYCDIVVSGPGTMNIDAAVFDKPIILVNFFRRPKKHLEGIIEYEYEHILHILESGGATVVKNPEELKQMIFTYLENRNLHKEGRERIVKEQVYKFDGKATERLTRQIIKFIQ